MANQKASDCELCGGPRSIEHRKAHYVWNSKKPYRPKRLPTPKCDNPECLANTAMK